MADVVHSHGRRHGRKRKADVVIQPSVYLRSVGRRGGVLLHIFTQDAVDVRLITLAVRRMTFEPGDHVAITSRRGFLLDGPKKQAALRAAPVTDFWYVLRIDFVVRQRSQGLNHCLLRWR